MQFDTWEMQVYKLHPLKSFSTHRYPTEYHLSFDICVSNGIWYPLISNRKSLYGIPYRKSLQAIHIGYSCVQFLEEILVCNPYRKPLRNSLHAIHIGNPYGNPYMTRCSLRRHFGDSCSNSSSRHCSMRIGTQNFVWKCGLTPYSEPRSSVECETTVYLQSMPCVSACSLQAANNRVSHITNRRAACNRFRNYW